MLLIIQVKIITGIIHNRAVKSKQDKKILSLIFSIPIFNSGFK